MQYNLPKLLLSRLETILGKNFDSVMHAFDNEKIGVFRINSLRSEGNEVFEEFKKRGITITPFAGLAGIYIFDKKDSFVLKGTEAFYQGRIYLQSLSSMLPVLVLDPKQGERILDVCAAPGSKTTQMAMIMQNEGHIIALEQNQIRFDKLMYNARLQGASIIEGKKMDARKFFESEESLFDRILLDAPCSAEGRISLANEKSYGFWTLENIRKKAELQYELLSLAVMSLKQGGTLVYSTCTLAPEENEGVISRILQEHPELSLKPIEIGLSGKAWWKSGITRFGSQSFDEAVTKTVRILPSEETEGFYMANIVKR